MDVGDGDIEIEGEKEMLGVPVVVIVPELVTVFVAVGVNPLVTELLRVTELVGDGLIDGVIEGDPAHATNRILHPM